MIICEKLVISWRVASLLSVDGPEHKMRCQEDRMVAAETVDLDF
jgi:hypothetical protein